MTNEKLEKANLLKKVLGDLQAILNNPLTNWVKEEDHPLLAVLILKKEEIFKKAESDYRSAIQKTIDLIEKEFKQL